jgi:hypothetical protein
MSLPGVIAPELDAYADPGRAPAAPITRPANESAHARVVRPIGEREGLVIAGVVESLPVSRGMRHRRRMSRGLNLGLADIARIGD